MFNERAVCQAIIDCCCELEWPASRFCVQVLDDSTDRVTRELVDEKVSEWRERGVNVVCLRRTNRQGYKAGAMKEGMDVLGVQGFEYVAVFDADFKPEPDFLLKTVPYLEGNPRVGYVQTRWVFTNPDESYLTKAQEVSLNYHMRCEQFTHSATGSFFNFNGTAGVWRRACIEAAGGWNSRTTVEDMDLSLRAYVKGWSAIFLEDVTCLNELPASFFAYRKQQHRWTCGPVQLLVRAAGDIWAAPIPLPRKIELTVMYFGVRKVATHFVALGFFCALVPLAVLTPEVAIPTWVLVHLPVAVTMSTAWFTPRGWVYSILYVLFENAMGLVKLWAVVTGLLDLKRAQEWVVTTKLGSSDKRPGTSASMGPSCKIYAGELAMGLFLLAAGAAGLLGGRHWGMSSYLLLQGCVFFAFGFNMVDAGGMLGGRLDAGLLGLGGRSAARRAQRDLRRRQTM
jgi:beta-mannan synthase